MPGKKASKKKLRRIVAEVLDQRGHRHEAEAADAERQRAEIAAGFALGWTRCTAERARFPASFADQLLERGWSDLQAADVLRGAARLPVQ
jgi:hypothetical protein